MLQSRTRWRTRADPMKPQPPVTRMRPGVLTDGLFISRCGLLRGRGSGAGVSRRSGIQEVPAPCVSDKTHLLTRHPQPRRAGDFTHATTKGAEGTRHVESVPTGRPPESR